MRGLTRFEIDILIDAATNVGEPRVPWSPHSNAVSLQLVQRRLIMLREDPDGWTRGVITSLGRLVLSIVLTEPSLVRNEL